MLKIAEYSSATEALKDKVIRALNEGGVEYDLPGREDDKIRLVFAGQYSAGKSTIIKMLTGNQDIATGAEITTQEALERGMEPIREFMFEQMDGGEKDLQLFLDIAGIEEVNTREDVPNSVLIPAFIISELRIAFIIGFLIYIPFLIIDMVVASTLMSMGMMMLPPTTISMPFKILLFVVADGWDLIIGQLVKTFY